MKEFLETEFVILDVETTGLSPVNGDRVIELAAWKIKNMVPYRQFHTLINPEREIPWEAFRVHGISQEMTDQAPKAPEVFPHFLKFIEGTVVLGYNVRFDWSFISAESAALELPMATVALVDVLKMARQALPGLPKYSLAQVAQHLKILQQQEHRALKDVEMTFLVFQELLIILQQQGLKEKAELLRQFKPDAPWGAGFRSRGSGKVSSDSGEEIAA